MNYLLFQQRPLLLLLSLVTLLCGSISSSSMATAFSATPLRRWSLRRRGGGGVGRRRRDDTATVTTTATATVTVPQQQLPKVEQVATLPEVLPTTAKADQSEENEQASLVFTCNSVFQSEPIPQQPSTVSPQDIQTFFEQRQQLDCMVSSGHERPIQHIGDSQQHAIDQQQLLSDWHDACRDVGATSLNTNTKAAGSIIRVATSAMKLPGLSLTSNAYIGCQLISPDPSQSNEYPTYEFVLIRDDQTAKGFAPAVWLFHKLTGNNNNNNDDSTAATTRKKTSPRTLSHVTVVSDNDELRFQFKVQFKIQIDFPATLIAILPMSKARAEQEGSMAIQRTLEKDLTNVMVVLHRQYCSTAAAAAAMEQQVVVQQQARR